MITFNYLVYHSSNDPMGSLIKPCKIRLFYDLGAVVEDVRTVFMRLNDTSISILNLN